MVVLRVKVEVARGAVEKEERARKPLFGSHLAPLLPVRRTPDTSVFWGSFSNQSGLEGIILGQVSATTFLDNRTPLTRRYIPRYRN